MNSTPLLSVVIVNYKVRDLLAQTVRSLRSADLYDQCEVIVVDNDSQDGSEELIVHEFPEVHWIGLKTNVGFGKGCNIGADVAKAPLLLMLNPDTIVSTDTLSAGIQYMKSHPEIGILGPKVLNQDGTFYKQCHRGFPTPLNALGHFTGLSKLFPHNKELSSYFMTWLSPDDAHEVDAISGSCFFIPTDLYQKIGGFDETFFMYGEDLDICVQVKREGKKVWYAPISKIIHFQGKSSTQRKVRSRLAFYNAMIIFSRKYAGSYGSFFPQQMIELAVFFQAALSFLLSFSRQIPALSIDLIIINVLIPIITTLRFNQLPKTNPYEYLSLWEVLPIHFISSAALTLPFIIFDMLKKKRKQFFTEAAISLGLFFSIFFFTYTIVFSRMALFISATLSVLMMIVWRNLAPHFSLFFSRLLRPQSKTIIISDSSLLVKVIEKISHQDEVIGILNSSISKEIDGYPVLGSLSDLESVMKNHSPDRIIIASHEDWYSTIIENLARGVLKNVTIQWLPPNNPHGELKEFSLS